MALGLSTALRNGMLGSAVAGDNKTFKDYFETGVIYVYGGTRPVTADDAVGTGTLLGIATKDALPFNFGDPTNGLEWQNAGANEAGVIELAVGFNLQFDGLADGVATWARMMGNALDNLGQSTVLPRVDFTAGTTTGDIIFAPNTNIVTGIRYTCSVGRIRLTQA